MPLLASSCSTPLAPIVRGGTVVALQDYSAAAASLFGNMRIPAALVAGAVIPLGFVAAPQLEKGKEGTVQRLVKIVHALLGILTLSMELITIVWSTISVNKLTCVSAGGRTRTHCAVALPRSLVGSLARAGRSPTLRPRT